MEEKKNLTQEQMEAVAGGGVIESAICLFKEHIWGSAISGKMTGNHPELGYYCYKCARCGKIKYTKENTKTNEVKEISKEEFDNAEF